MFNYESNNENKRMVIDDGDIDSENYSIDDYNNNKKNKHLLI